MTEAYEIAFAAYDGPSRFLVIGPEDFFERYADRASAQMRADELNNSQDWQDFIAAVAADDDGMQVVV